MDACNTTFYWRNAEIAKFLKHSCLILSIAVARTARHIPSIIRKILVPRNLHLRRPYTENVVVVELGNSLHTFFFATFALPAPIVFPPNPWDLLNPVNRSVWSHYCPQKHMSPVRKYVGRKFNNPPNGAWGLDTPSICQREVGVATAWPILPRLHWH